MSPEKDSPESNGLGAEHAHKERRHRQVRPGDVSGRRQKEFATYEVSKRVTFCAADVARVIFAETAHGAKRVVNHASPSNGVPGGGVAKDVEHIGKGPGRNNIGKLRRGPQTQPPVKLAGKLGILAIKRSDILGYTLIGPVTNDGSKRRPLPPARRERAAGGNGGHKG